MPWFNFSRPLKLRSVLFLNSKIFRFINFRVLEPNFNWLQNKSFEHGGFIIWKHAHFYVIKGWYEEAPPQKKATRTVFWGAKAQNCYSGRPRDKGLMKQIRIFCQILRLFLLAAAWQFSPVCRQAHKQCSESVVFSDLTKETCSLQGECSKENILNNVLLQIFLIFIDNICHQGLLSISLIP